MPVTPLRPGDPEQVGPHRLLGRLGQGGMGTVYLGVSPDDRAVAVKVLRDGPTDPDARRRFRHELGALQRVRGPHLVEVLDADVDADTPYLVTRFVPGRRLDELVADTGPLTGDALQLLARGTADALVGLHGAGVVHRDLTPGNVLVVDGSPQVIDLGLAVAADVTALTRSGLVVGTPGYLAPEQVTGQAVTPAVDVHAWGATTAFAGTGRPPYGTGRPEAVLYRIVHEAPDLDGLPAELRALVEAATAPEPRDRPRADELLTALGGPSTAETTVVRLPAGVDATTVLGRDATAVATVPRARPTAVLAPERHWSQAPDEQPQDRHHEPDDEPVDDWSWVDGPGRDPAGPDPVLPPRPSRARGAQAWLTGAAALALLAGLTLVLPVVGLATAVVALVLLRAAGRSAEVRALRRERRGARRADGLLATVGAPWQLLLGLLDTLASLPLLLLAAGVPAALVWLLDPVVDGLERPELAAATGAVLGLAAGLARRAHRRSRLLLRRALVTATPGPLAAAAVLALPLVAALLLLATAEGSAPSWWPSSP